MNKEQIIGAAQKRAGAIKQKAGKATGSKKLQVEGMIDQAMGATRQVVGNAKNAVHKATK